MWRRVWLVAGFCAALHGGSLAAQPLKSPSGEAPAVSAPDKLRLPERTVSQHPAPSKSRNGVSAISVWGTVAALVLLVVCLSLGVRLLQRHGPAGTRVLPTAALELLGQRLLSRGVSVHLLRCGTRVLLVGVGPDGIRTLGEFTDPVEVDLLIGACRQRDTDRNTFAHVFRRATQSASPPASVSSNAVPSIVTEVDGV